MINALIITLGVLHAFFFQIGWHDLAFFDPTLYEGLRQLMLDAERGRGASIAPLELTFSIQLSKEEGGGSVDLVPGGAHVSVTTDNIFEYVRQYAEYKMVTVAHKCLTVGSKVVYQCSFDLK